MAISHEEYLSRLPDDEIRAIKARADELIKQEAALRYSRDKPRRRKKAGRGDSTSTSQGSD